MRVSCGSWRERAVRGPVSRAVCREPPTELAVRRGRRRVLLTLELRPCERTEVRDSVSCMLYRSPDL